MSNPLRHVPEAQITQSIYQSTKLIQLAAKEKLLLTSMSTQSLLDPSSCILN